MNEKVANILRQARDLTPEERAQLIDALVEDDCEFATPEIAKAWEEEIGRRIDALDRGKIELVDIHEVIYKRRT